MSCTQIETVVSSATDVGAGDDVRLRRKTTNGDDILQNLLANVIRPRRVCRRHSFAFRCADNELDQDGDDGKHFESVLLVKVCNFPDWLGQLADDSSICC